jgi:hypothetical protein
MTKKPQNWGTVSARKVDKFKETLEGMLDDGGDLQGLWLKVKGWHIELKGYEQDMERAGPLTKFKYWLLGNPNERRFKSWESVSGCLTYKNVSAVKCLIKYITFGKQGYIIIDKDYDVEYQPGGFWSHQPCADLIKDALKHKRVLKETKY